MGADSAEKIADAAKGVISGSHIIIFSHILAQSLNSNRGISRALLVLALCIGGFAARSSASAPPTTPPEGAPTTLAFDQVFQPNDRALFVGDELTQQMFYTRAVAAAVLALKPKADLRFFNGGKEGSTAKQALDWVDELMDLTRPTVVFLAFGLNESAALTGTTVVAFKQDLATLVDRIRRFDKVRWVVLLSPPPLQRGDLETSPTGRNQTLHELTIATYELAVAKKAGFVNLFDHMLEVYRQARAIDGPPLTLGGHFPTENAHVILASIVLAGVGVDTKRLQPVGWSPLPPWKMRRIRQALALRLEAQDLNRAQASRNLYEHLGRFDEQFFRLWRLSGRRGAEQRNALTKSTEQAWANVQTVAQRSYGKH